MTIILDNQTTEKTANEKKINQALTRNNNIIKQDWIFLEL